VSSIATWTSHYEANGFMWWALEDTDWVVERIRLDDGRYVYECRLGRVAQLAVRKFDLVIAQRFCERDGAALSMPWDAS
jgi:hypothetical protein